MTEIYYVAFAFICIFFPVFLIWVYAEWQMQELKQMNKGLTTAEIFKKAGVKNG